MNKQKGFSTILIVVIGLLVIGGGIYLFSNNSSWNTLKEGQTIEQQTSKQEGAETEYDKLSGILQTDEIFEYSNLYVTKYGGDVYLVSVFGFENEYSGSVYHIDLVNDEITKIESPYIYRDNGKMYGLKMYDVDYKTSMDGKNEKYTLDDSRLEEIADEVGIEKFKLTVEAFGGKPVYRVLVSTEYNPMTKEIKLLPNKKPDYPSSCYPKYCPDNGSSFFVLNEEKYTTSEFVSLGTLIDMNGQSREAFDLEFNYNRGTKKLSIQ